MNPVAAKHSGAPGRRPRVAFLGLGWIGLSRLKELAKSDSIEIAAVSDSYAPAVAAAIGVAPNAINASFEELLNDSIEGVVIATPNACHSEQTVAALKRGIAVFCQKPLGRNIAETWQAVNAARESDCLLQVDLSYRYIPGMQQIQKLARGGDLGKIFSVDLRFHNGYGPDKPWFYDQSISGGGCVLDLGVHLIDLALWTLNFPRVTKVSSALFSNGQQLRKPCTEVEDYAVAQMETECGTALNLSCSWNLSIGADAAIEVAFYGTKGAAVLRNVNGSFFEFVAELHRGTKREQLYSSGNNWHWGPSAALDWCEKLAAGGGFQTDTETVLNSAAIIDRIYAG
jgi:predicted dehydrogenase